MNLKTTGHVSVFGLVQSSGRALVASHEFDVRADGVTHYVNGEKRAEIEAQHWAAYCLDVPEAGQAQDRLDATAAAGLAPAA